VCEEEGNVSLDLLQRVSLDLHQIKVGLLTCIHAHNLSLSLSLSLALTSYQVLPSAREPLMLRSRCLYPRTPLLH
jgi:hypothetical protein